MREIARRLGLARSTVRETLKRAEDAGLSWPLPVDMSDGALEAALYARRRSKRGHRRIAELDWAGVHRELKRKHVTLLILWDEYIAANPGGYSYSRFCELYRSFEKTPSVSGCSSITPATASRSSSIGSPAKSAWRRSSSPFWGRRASPSQRRAGRRRCRTGSTPTYAPSRQSAAFRNSSCRTTPRPPSSRPASTSLRSIGPTPRWRRTTEPPFCQQGREDPATKQKSSRRC